MEKVFKTPAKNLSLNSQMSLSDHPNMSEARVNFPSLKYEL